MAVEGIRPVRDANYYLSEESLTIPTFEGKLAKILGIQGQAIDTATFLNLFNGYTTDQDGNRATKLPKYMHPDRRGAFEITLNLPKCGSVVGMIGEDSRVKDLVHQTAQDLARFIERESVVRVRRKETWGEERKPANLAWTIFTHPVSRANDPHLHAHVVFFNLSYDGRERTFKALETGYIDQRKLGDIAHKSMVKGFRQLGYKVRDNGKDYQVVGVPAEVKAVFSSRHDQIKEKEREYDDRATKAGNKVMSQKERGKLSVYDRPEKVTTPISALRNNWVSKLTKEQYRAVGFVVRKALSSLEQSRWADSLRNHFHKLYHSATQEQSIERVQSVGAYEDRGEARGGIER